MTDSHALPPQSADGKIIDQGGGGGHGHGQDEEALGPIDTAGWAAGILGVLVAALVAACFFIATAGAGAY